MNSVLKYLSNNNFICCLLDLRIKELIAISLIDHLPNKYLPSLDNPGSAIRPKV